MSKNEAKKEDKQEQAGVSNEMQTRIVTLLDKCNGIFAEGDDHQDVAEECKVLADELRVSNDNADKEEKAA